MPINSTDFEKSRREISGLLIEFLRFNFHLAYTVDELIEMLASMGRKVKSEEVERLLLPREYGGRVESNRINGVLYYKYKRVLGFVPMKKSR
jgi:hypothetical protein